jgi:DNA-directed RNA polymerase subunit N (RpoN/RPB10)
MATKCKEILVDLPNVRCVTCGKVLGHLHSRLEQLRIKNYTNEEIFEELEIKRPCCRNEMLYPPKFALFDSPDDDTTITGEERSIGSERVIGIRSRLMKLKETSASENKKERPKKTLCYYAV